MLLMNRETQVVLVKGEDDICSVRSSERGGRTCLLVRAPAGLFGLWGLGLAGGESGLIPKKNPRTK